MWMRGHLDGSYSWRDPSVGGIHWIHPEKVRGGDLEMHLGGTEGNLQGQDQKEERRQRCHKGCVDTWRDPLDPP